MTSIDDEEKIDDFLGLYTKEAIASRQRLLKILQQKLAQEESQPDNKP